MSMSSRSILHRYASEAVGAFVLLALAIFLVALFQAGRVHEWLNPGLSLRVLLPSEGLFGLREGATVEILGTPAGEVRGIVIEPGRRIYARVYIRESMASFIRRDSEAFIRKRFGVAGDAYLEISRGRGAPLDEDYAVLEASVERAPTETMGELLSDLRERVLPVVDDTGRAVSALLEVVANLQDPEGDLRRLLANLNRITGRIERGEGSIGRLVAETGMVEELEGLIRELNAMLTGFRPVLDELRVTVTNVAAMSEALGAQAQAVPGVTRQARSVLASLDSVLGSLGAALEDLEQTTPELPRITRNVSQAAESMPLLLIQTQQTVAELEGLIRQLRSLWLLGGGSDAEGAEPASRISPLDVAP